MFKRIFILLVVLVIVTSVSLLIPFPHGSWFLNHIILAVSLSQAAIYMVAAFLTLVSTFRIKALGGIVGISLKFVSLGLMLLGFAFLQLPFVVYFNLWPTSYFSSGIFFIPFLLGLPTMLIGMLIIGNRYIRKARVFLLGILFFCSILRVIFFFL